MRFGLYGVGLGAMAAPGATRIARLAEELGYESLWTGEHMALPRPQVPPSHRAPDHPFLDPIVALTYLAASTTTIRLATGVLLLPQRHPVQLAKELASLDVLSGGRLIAGVGVGYVQSELRALGVDPRTRGARADEHLAAMLALWRNDAPCFRGTFVSFDGIDAYPRPLERAGPPIIVGGNSPAGLRRTVAFGDGWYGYRVDAAATAKAVLELRELAKDAGRDPTDIEVTVTPVGPLDDDQVGAYLEAGVDRLVVIAEGADLDEVAAVVVANRPSRWHMAAPPDERTHR
jgi:probable F420-dependent oxidoreductase